jgi:hypothetical protein
MRQHVFRALAAILGAGALYVNVASILEDKGGVIQHHNLFFASLLLTYGVGGERLLNLVPSLRGYVRRKWGSRD